jgi:hypothetical protein
LEAFVVDGVDQYQLPMHVSGDKGGENVHVAEYMIHRRGVGIKAFKPVSSTRRDMRVCVFKLNASGEICVRTQCKCTSTCLQALKMRGWI